jgi:hypothetical protein
MPEFRSLEELREATRRALRQLALDSKERCVEGTQTIDLDLQESIKVYNPGDDNVGGATTITDLDAFVRLVQNLLLIFPNGDNAVEVLNPSSAFVSPDDMLVVSIVVPALRKMLAQTPREQRRRKVRKAQLSLERAKQNLLDAIQKVGAQFTKLVDALR